MTDAMSAVTFIRSCGLNHRHFKAFLEEMNMVTLVQCLSKGKVLQLLYHYEKKSKFSLLKYDSQSF